MKARWDWSAGLIALLATTVKLGSTARLTPLQWTMTEMGNPMLFSNLHHMHTQSTFSLHEKLKSKFRAGLGPQSMHST